MAVKIGRERPVKGPVLYRIGTGETTNILLDASNPGQWMAHCHIAEHLESMMMFHFTVEPRNP